MSGLKNLALCYVATASVFTMAAGLSAHRTTIAQLSAGLRAGVTMGLQEFGHADEGTSGLPARLDLAPPGPNDARDLAHSVLPPVPQKLVEPREIAAASMPVLIAPDLPEVTQPEPEKSVQPAPAPGDSALTPAMRVAVTARLKENLTAEMLKNFSLFLYVSKASSGPLAQRLYVFRKNAGGGLDLAYDWAASTGREALEVSPRGARTVTNTPRGYYELDPARMYRSYQSYNWDQSMPYAMFFNWENHGVQTGLAIHAATGADIDKLGSRASAGCVHLSPEHARTLYNLIRADYRGATPRFAYDSESETLSNKGELAHDKSGHLKMVDGYQVLIFIENFGGENVVAALD